MPTNRHNKELHILIQVWNSILEANQSVLAKKLSELDLSALSSWVGDCLESFYDIQRLLQELRNAAPDNRELTHDNVVDIFAELDHIKNHIIDAEKGFSVLINILGEKVDKTS
jgi:hypothetical protein